jgi:Icc-related predicted phosphoesterase
MEILLLADLHGIAPWYRWVRTEAHQFDLVCIAGNLIDMFRRTDEQIVLSATNGCRHSVPRACLWRSAAGTMITPSPSGFRS